MDRSIIQNFISRSLIGYTLFSLPTKREKAEDMRGREGGREREREVFPHGSGQCPAPNVAARLPCRQGTFLSLWTF